MGSSYSDVKTFNYSVPQGSCNGPAYFCLYPSTIKNVIDQELNLYAFADDHTISGSYRTITEGIDLKLKIERNLIQIHKWMQQNKLQMNTSKTEIIQFGTCKKLMMSNFSDIMVVNDVVKNSKCIRYLGAHLDESLNLKTHAQKRARNGL